MAWRREAAVRKTTTVPWMETVLREAPGRRPLRVLSVGCGTCPEAELLASALGGPEALELMGIDLDEVAVQEARRRLPWAAFVCADAATPPVHWHRAFDLVLVRRPDLLAQPQRWQLVLRVLPALLTPEGRVALTCLGEGEAQLGRRWLAEAGFHILSEEPLQSPQEGWLLIAALASSGGAPQPVLEVPVVVWEGGEAPTCDWRTGQCASPEEGERDGAG